MIINVKVNPKAKKNLVKKEKDDFFRVYVTAKAYAGKANKAMIEILAEYLGISRSKVSILSGEKSRLKIVRIDV